MIKRLLIVIVFLAAIFGGIFGWKYHQTQQLAAAQSEPPPPATIAATEVSMESWQPALRSVGSLIADKGIDVTTEIAGTVREIEFRSGSRVDQGDLLVQLDDTVDQAALAGLRAQRSLAEVQFRRAADLLPRRAVSQSEYDEAKAQFDAAEAGVTEQQARLAKMSIRAPFDGLLGIRRVDPGQYLTPGTRIVTLQALDPIHVDYSLPERSFARITTGQPVRIRISSYPGETFRGEVTAIESGLDEGTRSIAVRATLSNPGGRLRPGMFAEVETVQPDRREVLTVPRTAISFNTYGNYVFRVEEEQNGELTVQRKQVETGATRDGRVEVVSGLEAGQLVVSAGLVKLRDGQRVAIDNSVVLDGAEVTQK